DPPTTEIYTTTDTLSLHDALPIYNGRLQGLFGRHAERARHHLGKRPAIVGEVGEPDERLQLEVVEPVAGCCAQTRDLLVGRCSRHLPGGVVADRHAAAEVGVEADDCRLPRGD